MFEIEIVLGKEIVLGNLHDGEKRNAFQNLEVI